MAGGGAARIKRPARRWSTALTGISRSIWGMDCLVYFGYPTAHEDDAQRAVRAGLGIVEAIQHAPLLQHHGVQVRIGIHTGLVVVGEIGAAVGANS